jgi:hypothetical protein
MLHNPNWNNDVARAEIAAPAGLDRIEPTIEGLVAWLETQDPETTYYWYSGKECVIGLYLRTLGYSGVGDIGCGEYVKLESPYHIGHHEPHTFGAALARSRKALKGSLWHQLTGR